MKQMDIEKIKKREELCDEFQEKRNEEADLQARLEKLELREEIIKRWEAYKEKPTSWRRYRYHSVRIKYNDLYAC